MNNNKNLIIELSDDGEFPKLSKMKRSDCFVFLYDCEICEHANRIDDLEVASNKKIK